MEKTIEDFRVVEQIDGFVVQKRRVFKEYVGYFSTFGFGKIKECVVWKDIDKKGDIVLCVFGGESKIPEIYESLEHAKQEIEKFVKYPIYHYLAHDSEDGFPRFQIDRPTK